MCVCAGCNSRIFVVIAIHWLAGGNKCSETDLDLIDTEPSVWHCIDRLPSAALGPGQGTQSTERQQLRADKETSSRPGRHTLGTNSSLAGN